MPSRVSVEEQAQKLARSCGLDRPWLITRVLKIDGTSRVNIEEIVYQLTPILLSPTRWDKRQRKWLDDHTGNVGLSCGHKHWRRGEPVIQAKIRKSSTAEVEKDGKVWNFALNSVHERQLWCLDCAKSEADARGGKIDWLIGRLKP